MRVGCVLAPRKGLCSSSTMLARELASDQRRPRPTASNNPVLFNVTGGIQFSNEGTNLID